MIYFNEYFVSSGEQNRFRFCSLIIPGMQTLCATDKEETKFCLAGDTGDIY